MTAVIALLELCGFDYLEWTKLIIQAHNITHKQGVRYER